MLDQLSIFTRGGLILWTHSLTALKGTPIESLIRTCLLEERSGEASFQYSHDLTSYTLKWTYHNELGIVFVAVYQRILQLLYVDELLSMVRDQFSSIYSEKKFQYQEFTPIFEKLVREVERQGKMINHTSQTEKRADASVGARGLGNKQSQKQVKGSSKKTPKKGKEGKDDSSDGGSTSPSARGNGEVVDSKDEPEPADQNGTAGSGASGAAFDVSRLRQRKGAKTTPRKSGSFESLLNGNGGGPSSGKDAESAGGKKRVKELRKWDNSPASEKLDFTDGPPADGEEAEGAGGGVQEGVSRMDAQDEGEDDEDEEEEGDGAVVDAKKSAAAQQPKKGGWFTSVFHSLAGKASLDHEDMAPMLKVLKEQLIKKNVAEEIAEKLCESVKTSLAGRHHPSFTRVSVTVKTAMEEALQRILTPRRSIDILRDVHAAVDQGRPYVIVFVGVNGVGKSTNLAKVAYWLTQHNFKVMLAACDTFRSGAVEQLRTHGRRLQIPVFERGYEKDPAVVAKEAVKEATRTQRDIVLVDTAGRMQDNEPLMRALSKLVNVNKPDLVLFVGEALAGNDVVDQLSKFNQRLLDLSESSVPRVIDGILLTKFDTVDEKVGAALSLVYTSGAPIMFVGCGQSYVDLKKLNVKEVVKSLLK